MRKLIILLVAMMSAVAGHAQSISGPTSVGTGTPQAYSYTASGSVTSPQWRMGSNMGTINSQSQSGLVYNATITWNLPGTETLAFLDGSTLKAQTSVSITLSPPTASAATNIGTLSFTAKWVAVSGAGSYRLDVSESSGFSSFVTGFNNLTVTTNSAAVTVPAGKTYYYRVRSVVSGVTSGSSNVINLVTSPVATAPTNIVNNGFTANWNAVTGITSYKFDLSTVSDFSSFVSGYNGLSVTGTSVAVTIPQQQTYYYRVRANNTSGGAGNSNTIKVSALDFNYVKTTDVLVTGVTNDTQLGASTLGQRLITYNYADGLGRPLQTVQVQASPNQKDVVQPIAYDDYDREQYKYLPYVPGESNGFYKLNPVGTSAYAGSPHATYYSNGTTDKVQDDTNPFSKTTFEAGPMNRHDKDLGPGASWATNNKYVQHQYMINVHSTSSSSTQEKVIAWKVDATTGLPVRRSALTNYVQTGGYSSTGQLFIKGTVDEQGNAVREYTNKSGQVVLKKVRVVAGSTNLNSTTDWALTYYIYDDFGNLRYVLQPELSKKIHAGADTYVITTTDLDNFAFQYKYDARNRMIEKDVPGASVVYMVYDGRDRLVLTQDGNQRAGSLKNWTFTRYDALDRPVVTGIYAADSVLTQAKMQQRVNDYYANLATNGGAWFDTFVGNTATSVHGYDRLSYPPEANHLSYLTVTYYDNYDFRSLWQGSYTYSNDGLSVTVNGATYSQPSAASVSARGQVTGTKVKVLDGGVTGGPTWLKGVNYYDEKYRLIQTVTDNYKVATDRLSTLYDFNGKILKTKLSHEESDIAWKDVVGASQAGIRVTRTASGNGWGSSGAASVQSLPAGQDGWAEVTVFGTSRWAFGLSDQNTNASNTSIDYAFEFLTDNSLHIYENGVDKATVTGGYQIGDILRVARTGTAVKYFRNGIEVYPAGASVTQTPSTTLLIVDISIYSTSGTATNVRSSFSGSNYSVTRRFEYDHAGRLLKVFHAIADPVAWTNFTETSATDNVLTKTGSTSAWDAGAFSQQYIAAGKDGWMEFRLQETNTAKMIGFSDADVNANYTGIDYAIYAQNNGVFSVRENGTSKGSFSAYSVNDIFRIERKNGTVYYKKNGTVFYTSTVASSTVLYADCSLYNTGATVAYTYLGEGSGVSEVQLVQNEYNELGQLIDKKLHSVSATPFKQSVDYRYNIRGWLTSMNNSQLSNDGVTNDDTGDYFGMNLGYNADIGTGNPSLYNGNISAVKWSNYLGTATIKEKSYNYSYDPMNRLTGSYYKEKTSSWSEPANNGFDERGFGYDLNGNISKLTRFDKRSTGLMDSLVYNYGTGTLQSNKLLKVDDYGDDFKGFVDGTNTGNDYTYDANGNMTTDQNKGITTSITYNYLNLPEVVTRGGNTVRYIYDATGKKLAQMAAFSSTVKQTDYVGEFTYENDALQFIGHEEGRIVVVTPKLVYTNPGESVVDMTASNATLATVTQNGTEKYVTATSNGTVARTGIFPIGGTFPVVAGERYRIRAKGYRDKGTATSSSLAYLLIQASGTDLGWPGAALPASVTTAQTESWIEQSVTIPTGATTLQVGVVWNTVLAGEVIYLNEFEITKLESTTPEYQYNLKDHLGNVRLTFTTKQETEVVTATMEVANRTTESGQFLRYDKVRIVNTSPMFDHTNGTANGSSIRLSGSTDEKVGLVRTLSVMPGDVVSMEVYAKYLDTNTANWTAALTTLVGQISSGNTSAVTDGGSYAGNGATPFPYTGLNGTTSSTGTGPKAYLNYIMFDRDFNPITTDVTQTNFVRMTTAAMENGTTAPNGVAHELLSASVTVKQPGYMYIYLSNEETSPVEVYFDDFKVTQVKSPIIQTDDYYPFGLAFNSYSRESSTPQDFKYNGKEEQNELNLDWLDYGFRMYNPEIGRWSVIDALSEKHKAISPYVYVLNNPLIFIDPLGLDTLKAVEVTATRLNVDPGWTSFIQELGQDGYQNFVQNYYQNKLNAYRTPFAAGLYGLNSDGEVMIPDEILAQEWAETEEEALPALAALWAMDQTGEDPSSISYLFNPIAQASFLSKYVMTGVSPEEASKIVKSLGVQLAVAWVGQLSIPNPAGLSVKELRGSGGRINGFTVSNGKGWGAKSRFDVHPLKYPSKAGNSLSLPQILKNGKIPIPHYHRGKGNALRLHRPWEARPGKGFLDRF